MNKITGMVDMAKSLKEDDTVPLAGNANKYPYGLRITLDQDDLEKLSVDHSDWEVGATFHLHALAKVASIPENETEGAGSYCNVGLQITHLSGESEDAENQESEDEPSLEKHGYLRYK